MGILETVLNINITENTWKEALENHNVVSDEFDGVTFYRVVKKIEDLEKGSVITDSEIIFNFPHIARILQLENGIRKTFDNTFYVEEKVDGYNVRVAKVQDQVLAFTRGGYACPFSTDRMKDFFNIGRFFNDNPDLIVCGEIAGPENPYNLESPPYVTEDVNFYAFDIRIKNTDQQVPAEERYKLFDKYEIPTVTRFGKYTLSDIKRLKENVKDLNKNGCEGLVLKSTDPREKTLKYVTIGSCLRDIEVTSPVMVETPAEFFTHRILRAAFYLLEHNFPLDKTFIEKTGEAILLPIFESVKKAVKDGMLVEHFNVRFNKKQNINKLFEHFRKCKVDAVLINQKKIGRYWHAEFVKRCFSSCEIIQKHWEGFSHFD